MHAPGREIRNGSATDIRGHDISSRPAPSIVAADGHRGDAGIEGLTTRTHFVQGLQAHASLRARDYPPKICIVRGHRKEGLCWLLPCQAISGRIRIENTC